MSAEESILALVTFPPHINTQKVCRQISEDHPYLEDIQNVSENTLGVRLENIADLLDLDFMDSYGATSVKLNTLRS